MRLLTLASVVSVLALVGALARPAHGQAFPLNSDTALQPARGQLMQRTRVRWLRDVPKSGAGRRDTVVTIAALAYGWTPKFSTVFAFPVAYRHLDSVLGAPSDTRGVGDIRLLARYQAFKELGVGSASALTAIFGLEFPTFDDPFSSRSLDLIFGAVYSFRDDRHALDIDAVYQWIPTNDRDVNPGDVFDIDATYQWRFLPDRYTEIHEWTFAAIVEANWRMQAGANGASESRRNELFLSPGIAAVGPTVVLQIGAQIPVAQDVGPRALKSAFRITISVAFIFNP